MKHTIKKGDTFWALEKKHGLKHGTLQRLNPLINPRTLRIGSEIVISKDAVPSKKVVDDFKSNDENMTAFNIAQKAITLIENYAKRGVKYSQAKRMYGVDADFSDCSAFVYTVFKLCNALHIISTTHTAAMREEIHTKGGMFRNDNPKVGDLMMWGGHVTIVTEIKNDNVYFAHMGNSGARIGSARLVNNQLNYENTWGSGGFIGFWTYTRS